MSFKYKYNGKTSVYLPNYGEVKPKQIIEVDFEIDNPNFKKSYKRRKKTK